MKNLSIISYTCHTCSAWTVVLVTVVCIHTYILYVYGPICTYSPSMYILTYICMYICRVLTVCLCVHNIPHGFVFHPLSVYIHMYSRHSKYGRSTTPTSIDSNEDTDSSSLSSHTMDGLEGKDDHGGPLRGDGVRVHPVLDIPIPPVSAGVHTWSIHHG